MESRMLLVQRVVWIDAVVNLGASVLAPLVCGLAQLSISPLQIFLRVFACLGQHDIARQEGARVSAVSPIRVQHL